MALKYGIDEEVYNELPESIQESIKKTFEEAEAGKNLQTQVTQLTNEITELKKEKKPAQSTQQPTAENPWPDVQPSDMLNYQNRRDIILMNMSSDANKHVAFTVKKFRAEVMKYLDTSHPKYWASEQYVRNIVNMVAGEHQADILKAISERQPEFAPLYTEGAGGGNNGGDGKETDPAKLLTDEEKRVADRNGIPYKDFYESLQAVRNG